MDNDNKWGVLYCPRHVWGARKRWVRIRAALGSRGIDFDYVQSENTGSVGRLVRMMVNNGYRTIIIAGGDSALGDAVNCLMQCGPEVRSRVVLGCIPAGSMNDFAHFWGFSESDVEQTVEWLAARRVRRIDVGRLTYLDRRGERQQRYFLNCVNIGLIASLMNMKRRLRHVLLSRTLSYLMAFVLMVFQRLEYRMHLRIQTETLRRRVMSVCVGNGPGYGQTPSAVPYNGLLDVTVVYHPGVMQLVEGWYLLLRGKFLNHRSVHPYRTREVSVEDLGHAPVSVDGRLIQGAKAPLRVTVEQEMIQFLIPT